MDAALARHGLELTARSSGSFTLESGDAQAGGAARRYPRRRSSPRTTCSRWALAAAARASLSVPDELSVTGYDDIAYAAFTAPP